MQPHYLTLIRTGREKRLRTIDWNDENSSIGKIEMKIGHCIFRMIQVFMVTGHTHQHQCGFVVKIIAFSEDENNYYGFKNEEYILIATRKQDTLQAK